MHPKEWRIQQRVVVKITWERGIKVLVVVAKRIQKSSRMPKRSRIKLANQHSLLSKITPLL